MILLFLARIGPVEGGKIYKRKQITRGHSIGISANSLGWDAPGSF
jgi:hypothetical protein